MEPEEVVGFWHSDTFRMHPRIKANWDYLSTPRENFDAAYKKMFSANICQREYHPVEEKKHHQIDKLNYYKG